MCYSMEFIKKIIWQCFIARTPGGSAIADLAIEGQTRFDLESFRTDRFGRIDTFSSEWMKRCANARSKKG